MSSGMFRGKESSNRIELSQLVQDLLNFAVLGSLQLWGGGRWVGGVLEYFTCTCMCMHARAHTHMYTCIELEMAADMEASMFSMISMFNMHVRACVHVCACICMCVCMEHPLHTHTCPQPHPPIHHPPGRWTPGISKNSITVELIKIFQFRLKI